MTNYRSYRYITKLSLYSNKINRHTKSSQTDTQKETNKQTTTTTIRKLETKYNFYIESLHNTLKKLFIKICNMIPITII